MPELCLSAFIRGSLLWKVGSGVFVPSFRRILVVVFLLVLE